MSKRIKITIHPDGTIQAEINGVKGSRCTKYIKILEDILDAECYESAYNSEFYETEEITLSETETVTLQSK